MFKQTIELVEGRLAELRQQVASLEEELTHLRNIQAEDERIRGERADEIDLLEDED